MMHSPVSLNVKASRSGSIPGSECYCQRGMGAAGFALILALVMMAFLVLLTISLSTMIMVEVQVASVAKQQMQARENASMGLKVAIGELQRYAGPDQRMTAQGGIVPGALAERSGWTGVWRTDIPGTGAAFDQGGPHWLISGSGNANVSDGELVDPVELLSAQQGHERVEVGREYFVNEQGQVIGSFAFWVVDEGVKARINVLESEANYALLPGNPDYLARLQSSRRTSWESLEDWDNLLQSSSEDRIRLGRVRSFDEGPLLHPALIRPQDRFFNDVTFYSRGVLANTATGGLKRDLTRILESDFNEDPNYADNVELFADGPVWGLIRSFYNLPLDNALTGTAEAEVSVRPQTNEQHGVYPIPVMVDINWGFRTSSNTHGPETQVEVTMQPVVVLANPYNVALEATDYRLVWDIEEIIPPTPGNNGQIQAFFTDTLVGLNNQGITMRRPPSQLLGETLQFRFNGLAFRPGEVKVFTMESGVSGGTYPAGGIPMQNRFLINTFIYQPTGYFLTEEEFNRTYLIGRMRFSDLRLEWYKEGESIPLQVIDKIASNSSPYLRLEGWTQIHPSVSSQIIPNRHRLRHSGYDTTRIMTIDAQGNTAPTGDGTRWLANYNIMAPFSTEPPASLHDWKTNPLWNGFGDNQGNNLSENISANTPVNNPVMPTRLTHAYWGPGDGSIQAPSQESFVALFEIPRRSMSSLGELQHANLAPQSWQPAYSVGNSWASPHVQGAQADFSYQINEALWDDYFFSTVITDSNGNALDGPANSRLSTWGLSAPAPYNWNTSAANLGLDGAFNVNSTSEDAWRALLGSMNGRGLQYLNPLGLNPTVQTVNSTENLFSRFIVPVGNADHSWRGFRELTQNQIDELASEIVQRIRQRGPFKSLSEFINRDLSAPQNSEANLKGLLQAAIDSTDINSSFGSPTTSTDPDLPYPQAAEGMRSTAAPGYITQADILRLLGPLLQSRSDTFRVRVYGDTRNSLTGAIESRAWAEAIVQRIPEYVNPLADAPEVFPPTDTVNQEFGRRFIVTQFRWLNESEI